MITLLSTQFDQQYFDSHYSQYFNELTPAMHEKIATYKFVKDKALSLTGKILLLKGLKLLQMDHLNLFDLCYNEYRKPYFEHNIFFNISHSNKYVLCAISKKHDLGIDIEHKKSLLEYPIKQIFTPTEEEIFSKLKHKEEFFYYVWTRKEAVLKASGKGLSNDLNIIEILDSSLTFENTIWTLHTQALGVNYLYSIAFNATSSQLVTFEFSPCLRAAKTDKFFLGKSE